MSEPVSTVITALISPTQERASAGLMGAGQRLSETVGAEHVVVACGPEDSESASGLAHGADRVLLVRSPALVRGRQEVWLQCLTRIGSELNPAAIVLGNDALSQEITPRLAYRLGGASIGDAQTLTAEEGHISITRSVYGGKAMAKVKLQGTPAVVWVRAPSMDPARGRATPGQIEEWDFATEPEMKIQLLETQMDAGEGDRLEDARIIVSGGRGLGGPEPFEKLKELAKVLKGQTAASRAACDLGWAPHSWQVGQTGKKVAPQLYLASGISGASQHIMGIADSKAIAAINTDPNAPIFKHCQFGLVEDFHQVIGPLQEKLAELLA